MSANPTGPLHVGNGWWCAYGDALARVLERSGYKVWREYYVNDTGSQIRTLGESLLTRGRGEEVEEGGERADDGGELVLAADEELKDVAAEGDGVPAGEIADVED